MENEKLTTDPVDLEPADSFFQSGGLVESSGLAMAHKGDHVLTPQIRFEEIINKVFFDTHGSRWRHTFHVLKRKKTFPCKYCTKNLLFRFGNSDTVSDSYEDETSESNTD